MTITTQEIEPTLSGAEAFGIPLRPVVVDLYRDIHKGIRSELFATTEQAGRIDAAQAVERAVLADHVASVVDLLVTHAEHEDTHVQPVMERHLPDLADQVHDDHVRLEARLEDLLGRARECADTDDDPGWQLHRLYVELASFTSEYLRHQDLEERVIMPALEEAVGVDATLDLHMSIVGSIPPEQLMTSLTVMLPAMNIDDRSELPGGIQAGAPAEAFSQVWSVAGAVLEPSDLAPLGARLGM